MGKTKSKDEITIAYIKNDNKVVKISQAVIMYLRFSAAVLPSASRSQLLD